MMSIKPLRLVITKTAREDLSGICEHIKQDNPKAAKAFIQNLTDKLFSLAASGVTGSPRDLISPGLRGFPYRMRCFYFRIVEDKIYRCTGLAWQSRRDRKRLSI